MGEAQYSDGSEVYTPEGIRGTVTGEAEWDPDEEEWMHEVEWSDGVQSTHGESFFHDMSLEFDRG